MTNSRPIYSTAPKDPLVALEEYHAEQRVPDLVIEQERRDERLRAEGWSDEAINHRLDDGEETPTLNGGLIDSYHEGSLTPTRIDYAHPESATHHQSRSTSIRFPWWRSGPE